MIPDRVRILSPVLLAARLRDVVCIVFRPHYQLMILAGVEQVGDVDREGGLAALMGSGELPIYPDARTVIDRTEPQHKSTGWAVSCRGNLGCAEAPLIPTHPMMRRVRDARCRGLWGEWHANNVGKPGGRPPPVSLSEVIIVEGKRPQPRKVTPAFAKQLRSRVCAVLAGSDRKSGEVIFDHVDKHALDFLALQNFHFKRISLPPDFAAFRRALPGRSP